LIPKRLELLHELVPTATSIGYLVNPAGSGQGIAVEQLEKAAPALGIHVMFANARTPEEIEPAVEMLSRKGSVLCTLAPTHCLPFTARKYSRHWRPASNCPQSTTCVPPSMPADEGDCFWRHPCRACGEGRNDDDSGRLWEWNRSRLSGSCLEPQSAGRKRHRRYQHVHDACAKAT
jgi:ABC transporter substrate binding protein